MKKLFFASLLFVFASILSATPIVSARFPTKTVAYTVDITPPTISTAAIGTDGVTWTFVFSENVAIGAGGNAGWAVSTSTAGAETLTYSSGAGSNTLTYTGSPTVNSGETITSGLNYTQPTHGITDTAGNDLASIAGASVTNNSTHSGSGASATDTFNRTNATPISNPMSDGVSTWQTTAVGGYLAPVISSNVAACSTVGSYALGRVASPTFTGQHYAQVTVPPGGISSTTTIIGPCVRIQSSSSGNCYSARCSTNTTIQIAKVVDTGTIAQNALGSAFTVTGLVAGDVIKLSASGTSTVTLSLYVNGTLIGTQTDSTSPYTGGQPGFETKNNVDGPDAFSAADF